MQLLPQHFQLQGLRAEVLAAQLARGANPWFWGVEQLQLDNLALSAGRVRIEALRAILPDGLPITLAPGEVLDEDFAAAVESSPAGEILVYLALSPLDRGGQVQPLRERLASTSGPAVPDLSSGEFPEVIQIWRPALRLVSDEQRADAVVLPLLRLGKEPGGFGARPYVAPTARLSLASPLGQRIDALCQQVRRQCVFLSGRLRQLQQAEQRLDAQETARQLGALWARLPEVEARLRSAASGPAELHALLCGMAGQWSVLDPFNGVPLFPPLDYLDLLAGFEPVLRFLETTLAKVRIGYRSLAFDVDGDCAFSLQLPDSQSERQELVVGVRLGAGQGRADFDAWRNGLVVASASAIPGLLQRRMSGFVPRVLPHSEQIAYGVGDDLFLFSLQLAGEGFDPSQRLCVRASAETSRATSLVLFIAETRDAG